MQSGFWKADWFLGVLVVALFALFGFCSAVKGTTERTTMRYVRWRKERRLRREMRALVRATSSPIAP